MSSSSAPAPSARIVLGNRRFTLLSPTLVRIEYAPGGAFEERRSMLAWAEQRPLPFDGAWDVLETGAMQIRAAGNENPCNRLNLEIRWSDGRLVQFWRPGDRDHQNLGGTLRSLDRYGGEPCRLDGVHPATLESPDVSGTSWPAWLHCEVDPLYEPLHPARPEEYNRGHWLKEAQRARNDGRYLERTFNWYKDARKFCPGILSPSGYAVLNDSEGAVLDADGFPVERDLPGLQDWYFFAYARDYRRALADFRLLTGPAPLPPHKSLGIVFSRWPAFSEGEIDDMARAFAANGYPLSTLVMDMEWHKEGWGHWEFKPGLIPDPQRFFARCHGHGLEVVFNDHPLDVREDDAHFEPYLAAAGPGVEVREREYHGKRLRMAGIDICDKRQNRALREVCHRPILEQGLDYWWNDGSRGQLAGTSGQLVCNQTCFDESQRGGRRGWLFARTGGLGSHRAGVFFTGDANSDWEVLRLQVEFNVRAGGVGLSHISHDIGGFAVPHNELAQNGAGAKIMNPERYLRWLQFGVFGPVLRFHCAPGCGSRLPYDYDDALDGACRRWLRVRHSLLPYLYTAADEFRRSGVPLVRGLFLDDPGNDAAYRYDEYGFGPALLVAPVVTPGGRRCLYLPPGGWWEFETGTLLEGGTEFTRETPPGEVPVYAHAGSVVPRRDPDDNIHAPHIARLWLDVYGGADGAGELYEDDGVSTDYLRARCCRSRFALKQHDAGMTLSGAVAAGKPFGAARQITVTLSAARPVTAARLGGAALPVTACGANRWRIELPEGPADRPWTLELATS